MQYEVISIAVGQKSGRQESNDKTNIFEYKTENHYMAHDQLVGTTQEFQDL